MVLAENKDSYGKIMQQVKIRVRGQIDRDWTSWFGGLTITHTRQGDSILAGPMQDQAELRGMLSRLADLGLELVSVTTKPGGVRVFKRR
jgi:hypothetical protein